MDKRNIKMQRMWKYFIEAAADIIQDEGIDQVTIRKIADKAGYNSGTLYNYFDDLSHVLFFASMRFLKPYTTEAAETLKKGNNSIEKYLLAWECFCKHSFTDPKLFHTIFLMDIGSKPDALFEQYYQVYSSDILDFPEDLKPVLFQQSMTKRGLSLLEQAVSEGVIEEAQIESINELTTLVWQGMLTNLLNKRQSYTPEVATKKTMNYIHQIVTHREVFTT
ncbi:TetR/AcrR family transcriptional regulator [Alkalicoccobacillus porphyridii]|uniref:TetR/AcrR family transcriptional regulator n=1 Tax=Alkalicoccobacillus porphyridii TaxID=2597270 RepID=A0A553ZYR0_9BACI|nr:TetR/AcrR family transcriptional regulator [Alkalicoccobacillus porphyridii]TSB46590.1 TetR/AcrR family transcriptional regulator [Alkalicoccobacillus porphyridii]